MANKFGKTWWGEQWLNTLSNIDYENRLPRGITYANKGAVTKINIKENRINAKVQGTKRKPYNVDIILPPFFEPELSEFIKKLSTRPTIISKLLNMELSPEVLSIAEEMGLKVFPKQWSDFKMQCSCPDWAVPCKHLAAVVYKVCAEIDNNPFLVFDLHQVNLIKELNKIGIFVSKEQNRIPKIEHLLFDKNKNQNNTNYYEENAYKKLQFSQIANLHEPILALLNDFPVFYQEYGNFKDKYKIILNRIFNDTKKVIQGKISIESLFSKHISNNYELNKRYNQQIKIDDNFDTKVTIGNETFSFIDFLQQMIKVPYSKIIDYTPSTAALHTVLQFSIQLLAHGAIVPQIIQQNENNYNIRWIPAMISKNIRELVEKLDEILPPETFVWIKDNKKQIINYQLGQNLTSLFITEIINILNNKNTDDIFLKLFFENFSYDFKKPGEESLSGGIQVWLQKYFITQGNYKPQIIIEEINDENFLFKINIFDKNDNEKLNIPIDLKIILNNKIYDKKRYEILQSLTQLSSFIEGLDDYINSLGNKKIIFDINSFSKILFEIIPAIQLLDIEILLPKSLQDILKPKTSIKIKRQESGSGKSYLRLDNILDFDWKIAIGDDVVDEKDFKLLLKRSEGLIKYKSNYIYVSQQELEKIFKYFSESKELDAFDILRSALSGEYKGAKIGMTDEVRALIEELTKISDIELPKNITASLRPYQIRGYSWLYRNSKIGFGSVLADDMGLGKTLQVITMLLKFKEENLLNNEKALVIAPTGVLSNWQKEIEKFAPTLKSIIYHGTNRKIYNDDFDILITSYGIIRSDYKTMKNRKWQALIIDEAQNIKNSNTAQAKAIKSLVANNFIAMSGTPVENRLSEMWSIMDFCNRGLLGNIKEFNENFANAIELNNDTEVANKLKKVTSPFLMRRLKSDKTIISDLPDKIEMDVYANLVKEQASLYEKTLEKAMEEIEGITDTDSKSLFVRQGIVLQMILALKQICNHPTQFLKNNIYDPSLSGKTELLFDKLDSIVENNEKVLIFTQFAEMGKILQRFINERYNEDVMFYHGGSNIKQRNKMIDNFQNNRADKIFILSLKAAGTGLNLTAANHVIHYDLWWNPAVENQATDRAYRIGQKNNVMVHRFITKNTFEERINEMIQNKKNLADISVATGESWIGNLSNKELKEIFSI